MVQSNRYSLKYRRRREGRTDYKKRLTLLKSRTHRLVIRKSNNHMVVQVVDYHPDGDIIVSQASTKELKGFGWDHHTGNIPAAYLVGFLAATRAKKANIDNAIVDLGMQKPHHGGRLFAVIKGAVEAGLKIPVSEVTFPSDERATGAHINDKIPKLVESVKKKETA